MVLFPFVVVANMDDDKKFPIFSKEEENCVTFEANVSTFARLCSLVATAVGIVAFLTLLGALGLSLPLLSPRSFLLSFSSSSSLFFGLANDDRLAILSFCGVGEDE